MRKPRIWIGLAVVSLAAIAALYMAGGVMLCETSLHVPRRLPPATRSGIAPHWRPVEMTARDGAVLKAWLLSRAIANGDCVMTLHGIADSRTETAGLARLFVENHYTVLMPDIRAHGESGGAIATYGLLEAGDVHQWVDWLIASEHPRNLFAMGESLGAAVLLQSLAVEPRFRAVVAESPFANLKDIAEYRVARMLPVPQWLAYAAAKPMVWSGFLYAMWKYGVDFRAVRPEDAIGFSSTPVLLIHGLADTIRLRVTRKSSPQRARTVRPCGSCLAPGIRKPLERRRKNSDTECSTGCPITLDSYFFSLPSLRCRVPMARKCDGPANAYSSLRRGTR